LTVAEARLFGVGRGRELGRAMDQLFDQQHAARLLGLSVRTLERHRVAGTGPRFVRLGRLVRYREVDLADWVDAGLRSSTSDMGIELIEKNGSSS